MGGGDVCMYMYVRGPRGERTGCVCVTGEGGGDGVCGVKITFSLYNII